MSTDRRTFIKTATGAAGALGLAGLPLAANAAPSAEATPAAEPRRVERAPASLNILILGGTGFTGPEQVDYALARGHKVTLFNRNRTRPDMFKGKVDQLIGDLNDNVAELAGKKFDVVLDNPTTFPAWVRNAAQHLKGNVGHYIFISTMSVYPDNSRPGLDESDGTTPMPADLDPYTLVRENASKYYGALKTAAEKECEKHYPGKVTVVRPGLIVGPLDRSDRFTYWPARIDRGGEMIAPGTPDDPTQWIDSRDLAEWMIRLAEQKVLGTFNAVGTTRPMAELLYGVKAVTNTPGKFTWIPADFLMANGLRGWRNMPVWLPPTGPTAGFLSRNNAKAVAAGLTFRPLAVTAADTLAWNKTRTEAELKSLADGAIAGTAAAKEAEVLAAWHAKLKADSKE